MRVKERIGRRGASAVHICAAVVCADEMHGLQFHYRTEHPLRAASRELFDIVSLVAYKELEADHSIYVLARVAQ